MHYLGGGGWHNPTIGIRPAPGLVLFQEIGRNPRFQKTCVGAMLSGQRHFPPTKWRANVWGIVQPKIAL